MTDPSVMLARLRLDNKSEKDDFKKLRTLGSGAFGCVDLCTVEKEKNYAKEGDKVAVKRIKTVSDAEMAKKEALVLNKLNHRFIVRYLDNFKDNLGQLCIVMEYCDRGTLEDLLSSWHVKPIEEFTTWRLVWQFSSALSFLHGQHPPILHNDLKPANILCKTRPDTGKIEIKIADFGVCNVLGKITVNILPYLNQIKYIRPDPLRDVLLRLPARWYSLLPGSRGSERRRPTHLHLG